MDRPVYTVFLLGALLASLLGLSSYGTKAMAEEQKYLYAVNWSSSRPKLDLEVQGVFLSSAGRTAAADASLAISHWVRKGWNEMQLYAWPGPFEADYELRLALNYWLPEQNPNKDAEAAFTVVLYPGSTDPTPPGHSRSG